MEKLSARSIKEDVVDRPLPVGIENVAACVEPLKIAAASTSKM
jgi:hypothetical protein